MCDFVAIGERETWPKMEMIRNQTRISQTLGAINRDYHTLPAKKLLSH